MSYESNNDERESAYDDDDGVGRQLDRAERAGSSSLRRRRAVTAKKISHRRHSVWKEKLAISERKRRCRSGSYYDASHGTLPPSCGSASRGGDDDGDDVDVDVGSIDVGVVIDIADSSTTADDVADVVVVVVDSVDDCSAVDAVAVVDVVCLATPSSSSLSSLLLLLMMSSSSSSVRCAFVLSPIV
jgi:hypothetical protein